MPVNATHPEYDASLPAWQRARDVFAGDDAVKAAGEKYLPHLDSQSDEEYASYRKRAAFFNAAARTLDEYLDLIFRRAPVTTVANPEQLRGFVDDCDGWGTDFDRYARRVVSEVLSVGRGGTLMLMESERPWITFWRAEDILNWEVEQLGERMVLTRVVLKDAKRLCVLRLQLGDSASPGSSVTSGNDGGKGPLRAGLKYTGAATAAYTPISRNPRLEYAAPFDSEKPTARLISCPSRLMSRL